MRLTWLLSSSRHAPHRSPVSTITNIIRTITLTRAATTWMRMCTISAPLGTIATLIRYTPTPPTITTTTTTQVERSVAVLLLSFSALFSGVFAAPEDGDLPGSEMVVESPSSAPTTPWMLLSSSNLLDISQFQLVSKPMDSLNQPMDSLNQLMDSLSLVMDSLSLVMDSLSLVMDSLNLVMAFLQPTVRLHQPMVRLVLLIPHKVTASHLLAPTPNTVLIKASRPWMEVVKVTDKWSAKSRAIRRTLRRHLIIIIIINLIKAASRPAGSDQSTQQHSFFRSNEELWKQVHSYIVIESRMRMPLGGPVSLPALVEAAYLPSKVGFDHL